MKVTDIRAAGLRGATPKGGWSAELTADDVVHTLVAVHTDEGLVGIGSVFSSEALVRGALQTLKPLFLGADPREPDRVTRSCMRTRSGSDAVAPSRTRSAASTSRCGTSSASRPDCRSARFSVVAIGSG